MYRAPPPPVLPPPMDESQALPIHRLFHERVRKLQQSPRWSVKTEHYPRLASSVRKALEDAVQDFIKSDKFRSIQRDFPPDAYVHAVKYMLQNGYPPPPPPRVESAVPRARQEAATTHTHTSIAALAAQRFMVELARLVCEDRKYQDLEWALQGYGTGRSGLPPTSREKQCVLNLVDTVITRKFPGFLRHPLYLRLKRENRIMTHDDACCYIFRIKYCLVYYIHDDWEGIPCDCEL